MILVAVGACLLLLAADALLTSACGAAVQAGSTSVEALAAEAAERLTRILDAQRVTIPVLQEHGAELIRCFADDIVSLFRDPGTAIDAALEIHRRVQLFNKSSLASEHPTVCCAGVGYGQVLAIGPNLAQGDEMNRASKLGEDVARGRETLITERVHEAVAAREDIVFERQEHDDLLFPFYRVKEPE